MKYTVKGSVTLNYEMEIEANSKDEAIEKVEDTYMSINYYNNGTIDMDEGEFVGDNDDFEICEVTEKEG